MDHPTLNVKEQMKALDFRYLYVPNYLIETWTHIMLQEGLVGSGNFFVDQMNSCLKKAEQQFAAEVDEMRVEVSILRHLKKNILENENLWVINENPAKKTIEWIRENAVQLKDLY